MKLLILGGTNDALRIAETLHKQGITVIYSLAGLARTPNADFEVITGGFAQHSDMSSYIKMHSISGILDATHPYANVISNTAFEAANANDIPHWQFDRPAWEAQAEDNWLEYDDWEDLWPMLRHKKSLFITTGQVDSSTLDTLSKTLSAQVLLRIASKPKEHEHKHEQSQEYLKEKIRWIQAIGPFTLEQEKALMQEYGIDALISKNSGGDATMAKLEAARQLQIPVYFLKRPTYARFQNDELNSKDFFITIESCAAAVWKYFDKI